MNHLSEIIKNRVIINPILHLNVNMIIKIEMYLRPCLKKILPLVLCPSQYTTKAKEILIIILH